MNDSSGRQIGGAAGASLPSRRTLLGAAALTAGIAYAQDKPAPAAAAPPKAPPQAAPRQPIAETASGKVRGYMSRGIYAFKGVPYGAPTGGGARFQRPAKPAPWTGVRSSVNWGHACPCALPWNEVGDNTPHSDEDGYVFSRGYSMPAGEDCLRVNVWTPSLTASNRQR